MDIEKIKEKLAIEISKSDKWLDKLNDTNPGHYGVEDWDVKISVDNIWVDIPNRTFNFNKVTFDFELQIGGSSKESGFKSSFSKVAKGQGAFKFNNSIDISINEIEIEFDMDLFPA